MTLKSKLDLKRTMLLLKTLLLSSGEKNILKNTKDKDVIKNAKTRRTGMIVLYIMVTVYALITAIGYGAYGLADMLPITTIMAVSAVSFLFTIFKTNGYLFAFREYDMLMSMPFEIPEIVAAKFMYMYISGSPLLMILMFSMLVGYAIFAETGAVAILIWLVMGLFAALIPMVLGSIIGSFVTRLGAGFRYKKVVQAVLIFIVCIPLVFSRFFIEDVIRGDKTEEVFGSVATGINGASDYYLPGKWFARAIVEENVLYALLFIVCSVVLFLAFSLLIAKSYRKINSLLMAGAAKRKYKMTIQKKKSVISTIAFKEFKRFTGSTTYITNVGMGEVIALIFGLACLFIKPEKIVGALLQDAPITPDMLIVDIPILIFMFIGMVVSTCCSPSLEGKNEWILQSMPVSKLDIAKGKMLFNMYLTAPAMTLSVICACVGFKAGIVSTILCVVLGVVLCLFATNWGMVCGQKYKKLNWQNEVEVIKQGPAVPVYLLPNMFVTMGLLVGGVVLQMVLGTNLTLIILTVIYLILAFISYCVVKKQCRK